MQVHKLTINLHNMAEIVYSFHFIIVAYYQYSTKKFNERPVHHKQLIIQISKQRKFQQPSYSELRTVPVESETKYHGSAPATTKLLGICIG